MFLLSLFFSSVYFFSSSELGTVQMVSAQVFNTSGEESSEGGVSPCARSAECISNKPNLHLKHPGVPDGSDGTDETSYPERENSTLPVAYLPPLSCTCYTHHQNDMCVSLFAGAVVML
jgi:hypothetical protein